MKVGANKSDVVKIIKMAKAGEDAEHISYVLQIQVQAVKSFIPKKKESKSKAKLAEAYSD